MFTAWVDNFSKIWIFLGTLIWNALLNLEAARKQQYLENDSWYLGDIYIEEFLNNFLGLPDIGYPTLIERATWIAWDIINSPIAHQTGCCRSVCGLNNYGNHFPDCGDHIQHLTLAYYCTLHGRKKTSVGNLLTTRPLECSWNYTWFSVSSD